MCNVPPCCAPAPMASSIIADGACSLDMHHPHLSKFVPFAQQGTPIGITQVSGPRRCACLLQLAADPDAAGLCSMVFAPNASPLAGKQGSQLTSSKIGERLAAEAETSVSLAVQPASSAGEAFEVQARGELQLGLLIGAFHSCTCRMMLSLVWLSGV